MKDEDKKTAEVSNETPTEQVEEKSVESNLNEIKVQVISMPSEKAKVEDSISKKDKIDIGIKIITLLVTGISVLIAASSFFSTNQWKKFEHMSSKISSFSSNRSVKLVNQFLDYNKSGVQLDSGIYSVVTDDLLYEALVIDTIRGDFSPSEYKVRNAFDEYFEEVSSLYRETKYGVIEVEYIKPYLSYYIEIIANPQNTKKSRELKQRIWDYINYYGYSDVKELYKTMGYDIDKKQNTK